MSVTRSKSPSRTRRKASVATLRSRRLRYETRSGYPAETDSTSTRSGISAAKLTLLDGEVTACFVPAWHGSRRSCQMRMSPPIYGRNTPADLFRRHSQRPDHLSHRRHRIRFPTSHCVSDSSNQIDMMLVCIGESFHHGAERVRHDAVEVVNRRSLSSQFTTQPFRFLTGTPEMLADELKKRGSKAQVRAMKPGRDDSVIELTRSNARRQLRISKTEEGEARGMFDFGNGKTSDRSSHSRRIYRTPATSFVESLKINSITEKSRRDRRVLVKRRKPLRRMRSGFNQFLLPRPGIPIRYARQRARMRRWEDALFLNAQWPSLSCKSHQQSDGDARQITRP